MPVQWTISDVLHNGVLVQVVFNSRVNLNFAIVRDSYDGRFYSVMLEDIRYAG